MSEPPRRNAAGREIWFRASASEGGVYRPVTRQGCAVLFAAVAWILVCGTAMMVAIAWSADGRALLVGFVPVAIGLALVARAVIRHS